MTCRLYMLIIMVLGAFTPSTIFAQNNRISIHSGLFHSFFDESPVLNTNHPNKAVKPFSGLFYNSLGIQYDRKLNSKSRFSVEYNYYYEIYQNVYSELVKNVVSERQSNIFNLNYSQLIYSKPKINVPIGIGLNYRHGAEFIVVNYGYFQYLDIYEPLIETRIQRDLGLNLRAGIEYSPIRWLTLYSNFDLIGFVYLHDKNAIERIQDTYGYNKYPHRFDLSWRFGIGFNF